MLNNHNDKLIDVETIEVNKPGKHPKLWVYSILLVFLVVGLVISYHSFIFEYVETPHYEAADISDHAKTIEKVLTNIYDAQVKYKEANGKFAPSIAALIDNKYLQTQELGSIVKNGDKVEYFGYNITQENFADSNFEVTATSTLFKPAKMSINETGKVTMK